MPAHELLRLGLDLMDEADGALRRTASAPADDRARRATACLFRDGLLIALLASRPLRASNLLAIALGVHLRTAAQGRATLRFAAAETKGGRPIETTWPESLGPGLRRYLEEARPVLLAAAGPAASGAPTGPAPAARAALWIGRTGAPLGHGGLREALKRHTRRRFGHAVNAHLFRACAATTIVDADPSLVRHAAALLGHGGVRIAERSYVLADPRIALERHHDRIAAMRGTARGRRGARQGGADR